METMTRPRKWSARVARVILASLLIGSCIFRAFSRGSFNQNESALAADQFSANAVGTGDCSSAPASR
jgi:hypothetical protein